MEHLLFYYSSTGNSLYDAILIGKKLGNARLLSMRHKENMGIAIGKCDTIGFVFPIHHWGMPLTVRQFIEQLKVEQPGYAYAIITCGSWEVSGISELEKMLEDKGMSLDYSVLHKNVNSNITTMFPVAYNIEQNVKAEEELQKHIRRILKRKKGFGKKIFLKKFHNTALPQITRMAENMKMKFEISDACNQCGICIKVCARNNIIMAKKKPEHLNDCEKCLSCIQYCPREAINIKDLTEERKRYHHPFISSSRIAKSQILIQNGVIVDDFCSLGIDNVK